MPLPKPLKPGASKKRKAAVVAQTMHDLKHGPHHKDRSHAQEVAIAMKQSGQSRGKKSAERKAVTKAKKDANRMTRNKGRK